MIKKLVLFLVRKKLGLKKHQMFRFHNQSSKTDCYAFFNDAIKKIQMVKLGFLDKEVPMLEDSNVSLNYLLSDEVKVVIVDEIE